MIVLHGIWLDHNLQLWGETAGTVSDEVASPLMPDGAVGSSDVPDPVALEDAAGNAPAPTEVPNPATAPAGPPGDDGLRGPSGESLEFAPPWHPSALGVDELHAALGELSPDGLLTSIATESHADLWLPCRNGTPVSSKDERLSATDAAVDTVELAPWRVPTLVLGRAEAVDLLISLPQPLPRECGDSIRYWSRLAGYLVSLLGRRQFVPDVRRVERPVGNHTHRAVWRIVLRERAELKRLQRIALAMPPACRALLNRSEEDLEAAALVESFLQSGADALIRRSLAADPFFHQIHERARESAPPEVHWLSALIGDDPSMDVPPEDGGGFINLVRAWVGRLDEPDTTVPTKLCFELLEPSWEEPEEANPSTDDQERSTGDGAEDPSPVIRPPARRWRLRYQVQSLDGSGTLHDIAAVWREKNASRSILRPRLASRREQLVSDLTRAAEVFPRIEQSLKEDPPEGLDLSTWEAHAFIRDCAVLLESRGFGVRLPEWATRPDRQLGLRLLLKPSRGDGSGFTASEPGRLGLNSLVDFEWRIALGDNDLTLDEFERLRSRGAPLIRLRNEWVHLDEEAARNAARLLEQQRHGRMTLGQAIRAASGVTHVEAGLPIFGTEATSWIGDLLDEFAHARLDPVESPAGFDGTLRPYQKRGLAWLVFMDRVGIGACLADDMGLGKTIQLIALLLHEKSRSATAGPTLIFAPMSVVGNWHREFERFGKSLRVQVHHGQDRLTGEAFLQMVRETDAIITTYALGHRDLAILKRVNWHRIVLDEAQKIKNPSAAQTIAIRSLPSTCRVALTGTPLENHLSELWSIMEMLNPGLLGSAGDFRKRFAVPIERLADHQRADQLKRLIRPFVLRRVKSDPNVECDLPEKMEMRVFCNLTPEQAVLYEQVVGSTMNEVESASGIRRRGVILAALTRLKQVCNHPVHFLGGDGALTGRSGKCERLTEMLEEVIAEGDAALVFTQFREMGNLLVKLLTERLHTEVLFLHGGTPAKQRQAMIERFQDPRGNVKIFLLSLRAGGLGLNLTAANHVFHFDRWWNPAVEAQATDRAYRIGQTRRVQVHKFVCIGTIEDRIDKMLTEKTALAEQIVGSGDDWITSLSTEELRQHLMLSREAIGDV